MTSPSHKSRTSTCCSNQ